MKTRMCLAILAVSILLNYLESLNRKILKRNKSSLLYNNSYTNTCTPVSASDKPIITYNSYRSPNSRCGFITTTPF
jgi:hypothetical protein